MQDPARTTAKIARTVTLDLNDSNLLLDENRISLERAKRQASSLGFARDGIIVPSKDLYKRYNISNDESYDLLKENHQSRVRSTLSALALNHSMPALRLQWPYYKTKLPKQEARSFHRPQAHFKKGEPITFQIPSFLKRKHTKNKDATAIYNKTKDLSLGDNSHVLLLEYSEEHPMMLSNFGMCSRILNYYRKRNAEDTERPKCEVGEPRVLLLQDKSPLTIFGHIAAGETTPTLHNGLFQAPLFQQEAKSTDFLLVRNTTGTNGPKWFMRNIEHIRTVGQQLPSVDVPPPGGRKVTTAAKSRLKMISYRIIRRRNPHRISVADVTQHIADSTDMQNRQKLKDFMVFSKEYKEWEMRPGDPIPEEENVRTLVSPDDVCLLESTQVGQQHLEDSGFDATVTINEDGDDAKEGQSIEQQLAPWVTSKNFLNAAAGKAMLQLHGEGDPSGRGEAFSFLKTSMKGGFKAVGESVEDKIDAKKLKEMGGHSYNVAKQQKAYEEAIERIWEAQKQSLSSTIEHSDSEGDADEMNDPYEPNLPGMTPRSELPTPSIIRRRDDETMSSFSKFSTDSQAGRVLRITRVVESRRGGTEEVVELVTNARVIRQYLRRQKLLEAETIE